MGGAWVAALAAYQDAMLAAGRNRSTLWTYLVSLRKFATAHPDPWQVGPGDLTAFLEAYATGPAGQKGAMVAVRSFYAWAYEVGHVESDPAARAAGRKMRPHDGFPKRWRAAVAHYIDGQRVGEKTLRLRLGYLRRLAVDEADPWAVTPAALQGFVDGHPGASARNGARQALRSFFGFAYRAGLHTEDPAAAGLPTLLDGHQTHQLSLAWRAALDGYATWQRAGGARESTVRVRRAQVGTFARGRRPPAEVTEAELLEWLATPAWAAETRKSASVSLRSFYTWALRAGLVDVDPTRDLPRVRVPAGRPRPTPAVVYEHALAAADDRQRLMLLLAAYAGLRRAEIAAVHPRDFIDGVLHVTGKGGRQRIVPVHPVLADQVAAELERRRAGRTGTGWRLAAERVSPTAYLFPGQQPGTHVQPWAVGDALSELLGDSWSGHTLRHRFASRAYAATRDIRAVQELLGHSSPDTTARYTAVPDNAMREAVMAL